MTKAAVIPTEAEIARFHDRYIPEPNSGCWLWIGPLSCNGYGNMRASKKVVSAHRLSYIVHRGAIPEGLLILHKCDNPPCVNPDHLFAGTQSDNMADMSAKRRHPRRGVPNKPSRLTFEDVAEIRRLYGEGFGSMEKLGLRFKVSGATIQRAIRGKLQLAKEGAQ